MRTIIKIGTIYSRLHSDDDKVKNILWKMLRFRELNYYHSALYRQKKWDGFTNFFTLKAGQFLTGLLPEIRLALKMMKVDYEVIDDRNPANFLLNKIDESFLWCRDHKKPVVLRDYQVELTNLALKHKRGIIHAPTSAGKTAMLLSIIKCLDPKIKTLILVDTKELVYQTYNDLKLHGFNEVGMYFSDCKEPSTITVCLINSAPNLADTFPDIQALFVDEIHAMISTRCVNVYKQLNHCDIRIGFSATPFKFGGKDRCQMYKVKGHLGGVLQPEKKLTTQYLQEREILSSVDCTFYEIDKPNRPYDIYMDAVTFGISENNYLNTAVSKLVKTLKGRTLIVVERIPHGEKLVELIPGAFWLHGNQKKDIRQNTIEELKTHKGDFVAVAIDKIVNKGLNVFIHNLINCAGGKADHLVIQRMGRGLRTADDKDDLKYIDFFFKNNPYLETHSEERIRILEAEGHKIVVKKEFDF